jgi:hypothetical protein
MENKQILTSLEKQKKDLLNHLRSTSVSKHYQKQYDDFKTGRIVLVHGNLATMLKELDELSKQTIYDEIYFKKLAQFDSFDNEALIENFKQQFKGMFNKITDTGKQDEIQAIFIEYDFYYHFNSFAACYGIQEYPLVLEPRYTANELDYTKQVLVIEKGINFKQKWLSCEEFDDLDYCEIKSDLEKLFQLHSRVLLHKSLRRLEKDGALTIFKNRPFSFFINEHDCEEMSLFIY